MEPMYETADVMVSVPLNLLISLVERATKFEVMNEAEHSKYLDAYCRAARLQEQLDELLKPRKCECKCEETE